MRQIKMQIIHEVIRLRWKLVNGISWAETTKLTTGVGNIPKHAALCAACITDNKATKLINMR